VLKTCKKNHKVIGYNAKDFPSCPLCRTIKTLNEIAQDMQSKLDEINKKGN
jgi:hypothetical protein